MNNYKYITSEVVNATTNKSVLRDYDNNDLDIVLLDNGVYYFETCRYIKTADACHKIIKSLYPNAIYLYGDSIGMKYRHVYKKEYATRKQHA